MPKIKTSPKVDQAVDAFICTFSPNYQSDALELLLVNLFTMGVAIAPKEILGMLNKSITEYYSGEHRAGDAIVPKRVIQSDQVITAYD